MKRRLPNVSRCVASTRDSVSNTNIASGRIGLLSERGPFSSSSTSGKTRTAITSGVVADTSSIYLLRRILLQRCSDPPFRPKLFDKESVCLFEHACNPMQARLNEVQNCVDESSYGGSCCQQRTSVRIFQSFFQPVLLCDIKRSTVVIYRNWYRRRVVGLSKRMVVIFSFHPAFLSFTFVANNSIFFSDQSFGARFAALGALSIGSEATLGGNFPPICCSWVTLR